MTQRPTTIQDAIAQSEAIGLALLGVDVTGPCRYQGKPGYGNNYSCLRRDDARRGAGEPRRPDSYCCVCLAYWRAIQLTEALRVVAHDVEWARLDAAVEAEKKQKPSNVRSIKTEEAKCPKQTTRSKT